MRRVLVLVLVVIAFASQPSLAATLEGTWTLGLKPFDLVIDPTDGRVFVSNNAETDPDGRGRISVIDPASGRVSTLTTSLTSNMLAIDPAARRLYSSNSTPDASKRSFDVFDLTAMTLLTSLPIGGLGVALDPTSNRAFVAGGQYLAAIDLASNTITTRQAPTSQSWFGVVLDVSLHHIYLTNTDAGRPLLVVLDDRDLSLVAEVPLTLRPRFGLAVDPRNHLVYVAGEDPFGSPFDASAFFVVDPTTLTVVHTTSTPGFPLSISLAPTGQIYVTSTDASGCGCHVYEIDGSTFSITQRIPVPFLVQMGAIHPDGRLYATAWNSSANSPGYLEAVALGNHAPVIQSVALSPAGPRTNDLVQVSAVAADPDIRPLGTPDPTALSYEWSRNGNVISGAVGPSLDLSAPGAGNRGDTISVRVTASDGQLSSTATASVVVANTAPSVTVSLSESTPKTNAVLTATAIGSDDDRDTLTFTYTWRVNGVAKRTASGSSVTDSFDLGVKGNGDNGDTITVTVSASDDLSSSALASATASVAPGGKH